MTREEYMRKLVDMQTDVSAYKQEPCGDLICRQDAIKAIDEKAKRIKNADTLNGLAGAVGILYDLPPVNPQKPKWIPVSERLPEENGRYLCTVGTNYRNPREMYYVPKGKNNRTWASLDRAYVEDCFVIAWMPLPEPYKAESEE